MVVQQANNQPPGFATLQKIPVIFPWKITTPANEISAGISHPPSLMTPGWWCNNHLEKYELVNGKDVIPLYDGNNIHVWNHQPDYITLPLSFMNIPWTIPLLSLLCYYCWCLSLPWKSHEYPILWILWNLAFTSMIFANRLPYYIPLRELQTPNQIQVF
jgi:hypothetical protein